MNRYHFSGLVIAAVLCSTVFAQRQPKQPGRALPEGNGKAIVETACTTCHPASMITNAGHSPEEWKLVMERMVAAGAEVPQNQVAMVTEYLTKSFPEGDVPKAV